ncbi:MAG: bile acid:sodium symporter family protein [Saprospiraceae bacterium]
MLTTVFLPLSLFIIMLGMGLSLVVDDFLRVFKYPKAVAIGLTNQLILLPIIGFLIASNFGLTPAFAVGIMIIAACPGGVTSNLITHVAKGDTALSITMTAFASFVTVFSIPLIINYGLVEFMGESQTIKLPLLETMGKIIIITIFPVVLGMLIRINKPDFAIKMERPSRIASTIIFIVILVAIIISERERLIEYFVALSGATLALNIATMLLGYIAARLFKLNLKQSLSITIESGVQNGTLAIVIAESILNEAEMALPAGVYSILMFVTGGILMAYFGNRK